MISKDRENEEVEINGGITLALFGHSGENKSKSLIKQITGSLSGFIITIILLAIAVNAVASIIMGIVRLLSDEGKKQTAYDQIKNRGGAYTYLEDDALKRLGNYDVVSKIFRQNIIHMMLFRVSLQYHEYLIMI